MAAEPSCPFQAITVVVSAPLGTITILNSSYMPPITDPLLNPQFFFFNQPRSKNPKNNSKFNRPHLFPHCRNFNHLRDLRPKTTLYINLPTQSNRNPQIGNINLNCQADSWNLLANPTRHFNFQTPLLNSGLHNNFKQKIKANKPLI